MDRRSFLRRSSLAAGALLVGDAALEAFERLTHRKVFALGHPMPRVVFSVDKVQDRGLMQISATVLPYGLREAEVHRAVMAAAYPGWSKATRSDQTRSELAFRLAKLGQQVQAKHGISLDSMIPAMNAAIPTASIGARPIFS